MTELLFTPRDEFLKDRCDKLFDAMVRLGSLTMTKNVIDQMHLCLEELEYTLAELHAYNKKLRNNPYLYLLNIGENDEAE